jgi:hypothetical protein
VRACNADRPLYLDSNMVCVKRRGVSGLLAFFWLVCLWLGVCGVYFLMYAHAAAMMPIMPIIATMP